MRNSLLNIKGLICGLLIVTFFSSCLKFKEVEVTNIKSVKLIDLSDKGLTVESEIKINNPNWFDIKVVNSEFDIYTKGKLLAKASIDDKFVIPSKSENYHTVTLKSEYKDLAEGALGNMLQMTFGSDKINFKVKGHIKAKAFFISKKIDVEQEAEVPLKIF